MSSHNQSVREKGFKNRREVVGDVYADKSL